MRTQGRRRFPGGLPGICPGFAVVLAVLQAISCSRKNPTDDNLANHPIVDIQEDAAKAPIAIRIQIHGKASVGWLLGVELTGGLFQHGGPAVEKDCALLRTDGQNNAEYALTVVETPEDVPAALYVEISDSEPDAGAADAGDGRHICGGSVPVKRRVWQLGRSGASMADAGPSDGSDAEVDAADANGSGS
jgi:hypothetical protein